MSCLLPCAVSPCLPAARLLLLSYVPAPVLPCLLPLCPPPAPALCFCLLPAAYPHISILWTNRITRVFQSMWLMLDRSTVEQCSRGAVNGQWFPPFVGASSEGEGGMTQYCRADAPEDPWLSVHNHPNGIVYGENGSTQGTQGTDALNAGGANVWVSSIELTTYDVAENGFGHVRWEGDDWYLVRRVAGPPSWHPVDDDAQGTVEYGQYDPDPEVMSPLLCPACPPACLPLPAAPTAATVPTGPAPCCRPTLHSACYTLNTTGTRSCSHRVIFRCG